MNLHFYTNEEVKQTLTMPCAIHAMRNAFEQHNLQQYHMPVRNAVDIKHQEAATLCMPAYLEKNHALGVKIVSFFPRNAAKNLPAVSALMVLLDAETGLPKALIDGSALTAIRTGAVSGLATDLLARKDAATLAMIGTGAQAFNQVEAVCSVRKIEKINVYSRTLKNAERFAQTLPYKNVSVSTSVAEAAKGADVICCATTAEEPFLHPDMVEPGTHINAVGSFRPSMQEISGELLAKAKVFIDELDSSLTEAGEIIAALNRGLIQKESLTEIGAVVTGKQSGRENSQQITVFKSVGLAIQDVAAASALLAGH